MWNKSVKLKQQDEFKSKISPIMWKNQLKLSLKNASRWNCDATIAESGKNVENPGRVLGILTIKFKAPKELEVNLSQQLFPKQEKVETVKDVCPNFDDGSGSTFFEI